MIRWSSDEYKAGRDGHLEFDVELEYIDPMPPGHGINLVETLTTGYGYEYGYPRYDVIVTLPDGYRRRRGNLPGAGVYSLMQFAVTEV